MATSSRSIVTIRRIRAAGEILARLRIRLVRKEFKGTARDLADRSIEEIRAKWPAFKGAKPVVKPVTLRTGPAIYVSLERKDEPPYRVHFVVMTVGGKGCGLFCYGSGPVVNVVNQSGRDLPDAVLRTAGLPWAVTEMTTLQRGLAVIANPAVAGLLMLLGLVGLYAELQNPGAILPGVLGGICLLLGLFALSVLPTNWVGIGLLLLGLLFFLLEVKLAGHGFFAIGGGIAIILGAVLLFYRTDYAPRGEFWFLVAAATTAAAILGLLSYRALALQSLQFSDFAAILFQQRQAKKDTTDRV